MVYFVSSGDIYGDTVSDLIIGANRADPKGGIDAGKVYVIYGRENLPSTIDLDWESADLVICGDDPSDELGCSVSSGDINGDGVDDLIIGAPYNDSPGGEDAGVTYIIYCQ